MDMQHWSPEQEGCRQPSATRRIPLESVSRSMSKKVSVRSNQCNVFAHPFCNPLEHSLQRLGQILVHLVVIQSILCQRRHQLTNVELGLAITCKAMRVSVNRRSISLKIVEQRNLFEKYNTYLWAASCIIYKVISGKGRTS